MITENLSTLKIHKLTQAQYDRELAAGRIDPNALYLTPEEDIDLAPYITFEPAEDDIPKVYFTGALPTSKDDGDLRLNMRYISKTANFAYPVTLKVQGSSSASYAKKNFTLKPYKDSTYESKKKLAFKNWPEMNKFVLKAHWIDHSHVRNVGTAKIWGKIVKSRADYASLPEELRNAPNNGATDGFTVKVFSNGVYQGLYEWIVPKDKLFGQNSDIATHSILNSELNNQATCAFATTTPIIDGNWSEELQDTMSSTISTSFANLISFVAGATDEEFVANAENYFDVQSVIDYIIFARIFCIVDNLCRNQIFFTYDGTKWYEGCWDVDAVLGLPPTIREFFPYNTDFQTGYIAYKDYGVTNRLYQRVETLFMSRFKERYTELRNGVLSIENILDVYERLTDVITTYDGLLAEDYASTTGEGMFTNIPFISENNIQQIRNFISKRVPYMDEIVDAMTAESGTNSNLLANKHFATGFINYITGDYTNNNKTFNMTCEDYIPIKAGTTYVANVTGLESVVDATEPRVGIKYYTADKTYTGNYIDDAAAFTPHTFTVPDDINAAYLRVTFTIAVSDSTSADWSNAVYTLEEIQTITPDDPETPFITPDQLGSAEFSYGYINYLTGDTVDRTDGVTFGVYEADYVSVEPGKTYTVNVENAVVSSGEPIRVGIKYYTKDLAYTKKYVDDANAFIPYTFTVPTDIDAACLRLNFSAGYDNSVSVDWSNAIYTLNEVAE